MSKSTLVILTVMFFDERYNFFIGQSGVGILHNFTTNLSLLTPDDVIGGENYTNYAQGMIGRTLIGKLHLEDGEEISVLDQVNLTDCKGPLQPVF